MQTKTRAIVLVCQEQYEKQQHAPDDLNHLTKDRERYRHLNHASRRPSFCGDRRDCEQDIECVDYSNYTICLKTAHPIESFAKKLAPKHVALSTTDYTPPTIFAVLQ